MHEIEYMSPIENALRSSIHSRKKMQRYHTAENSALRSSSSLGAGYCTRVLAGEVARNSGGAIFAAVQRFFYMHIISFPAVTLAVFIFIRPDI